jgi:rhodanese-related sulfurtransferase
MKYNDSILIITTIVLALVAGFAGSYLYDQYSSVKDDNALIKEYYETENAVHVSPHSLRKSMAQGKEDYIIVDLRSKQEYETEHIIGAVNIPAYSDPNTSAYGDVDRIVSSFKKLKEENPDKSIVVYCYSIPCMTGRKVGKMLAEHDIYIKHLGIGWNEWRYYWTLWNHELEWNETDVNDYIAKGPLPGKYNKTQDSDVCPIGGSLGC